MPNISDTDLSNRIISPLNGTKSSKSGRYLCHELLESMITTISNHANSYLTSCCKHFLQSLATEHNISGFWINLSPARLQNPNKHDRKKQNIQKSDDVAVCKYNSNNNCPEKNFQLQSVCTKRIIKQKNLLSLPHSLQDDSSFIPHVIVFGKSGIIEKNCCSFEGKELPLPHFKFLFLKALYSYTNRLPNPIISPWLPSWTS